MLLKPRTAIPTDRFWTTLSCLFLLVAPSACVAHDPGLSSGQVQVGPERIQAELILARADLEGLVRLDMNSDGVVSSAELATAQPELQKLASESLAIRLDDQWAAMTEASFQLDELNNFHLTGIFPSAKARRLTVQSLLLQRLPRGHRQFITLFDSTHGVMAQALLSAQQDIVAAHLNKSFAPRADAPMDHSFQNFLTLGIEHIVTGYDHLLFLLALLIMAPGFRQAACIITSFTVAHSITLGLATLNAVNFNPSYVEPLIAASIVYVGIENLVRWGRPRGRWWLTFVFGLVHGFGFAGALRDLGVSAGAGGVTMPLLSFNLGVELGQIAIASILLPVIWWASKFPKLVRYAIPACSAVVIALGAWWFLQRTLW